jgi:hypothetical protein
MTCCGLSLSEVNSAYEAAEKATSWLLVVAGSPSRLRFVVAATERLELAVAATDLA